MSEDQLTKIEKRLYENDFGPNKIEYGAFGWKLLTNHGPDLSFEVGDSATTCDDPGCNCEEMLSISHTWAQFIEDTPNIMRELIAEIRDMKSAVKAMQEFSIIREDHKLYHNGKKIEIEDLLEDLFDIPKEDDDAE